MKPELRRVGESESPVVVIDEFTGDVPSTLRLAEQLAPYPPISNYYPGVRRTITEDDSAAWSFVERLCSDAAQFIAGAFDIERFDLLEASFSMVTKARDKLIPAQRMPHFDTTDPKHLALLHYLRVPAGSGTAFYRQRSTGIERVTDANRETFLRVAQSEMRSVPADSGYICGSTELFEQIDAVKAVSDRLIIYQGSLLHSGIIPAEMNLSADPREGRLTANIFVLGH
jgi:hypothetical protein